MRRVPVLSLGPSISTRREIMKKSRRFLILLGVVAVLAVEMFGAPTPSMAYKVCPQPQASICNSQPDNWMMCYNGFIFACMRNACFAQCHGFYGCETTPSCPN
jgi:hypothetical protein